MDRFYRRCTQVAVPAVLLAVTCGIAAWMHSRFDTIDATTFVATLAFPVIGYLVFSGKLTEFTAPGGWGVKFKTIAEESPAGEVVAEQDDLDYLRKGPAQALNRRIDAIKREGAPSLLVKLGVHEDYQREAFRRYLCALLSIRYDPIVIFVDKADRFVGSVPAAQVHAMFCGGSAFDNGRAQEFINQLNAGRPAGLTVFRLTRESLKDTDSRKTALNAFMKTGAPALVVVDADRTPVRLVRRDAVVTALLMALAGKSPSEP
jgi:hypothetical protein